MSKRYEIEKDKIYRQWVLWENIGSIKVELFKDKYIRNVKDKLKRIRGDK